MQNIPVVIERVFDASAADIWRAFTDVDQMKLWYFDIPEFKPEVGCKFQFEGGKDADRPYTHLCEVLEVVPRELLVHTWCYEGYPGESRLVIRLKSLDDQTVVRLEHHGLFSFPNDNPDLAIGNFLEGWNHIINTSLEDYLEKYG